jgi:Family of unknown function (DUF6328)
MVRLRLRPLNDTARANTRKLDDPALSNFREPKQANENGADGGRRSAHGCSWSASAVRFFSIFNERFETLSRCNQLLHLFAIFLTTLSIALIMSPAAYHRIVEPEIGSQFFVRFTSRLIAAAMVPLMFSLTVDAYIVAIIVARSAFVSATIAVSIFVVFAGLWFAYPLAKRRRALLSAAR